MSPRIHPTAFVHDSAEVIGDVRVDRRASVWPLAVLRGDVDRIVVGAGTNVQDLVAIHCREGQPAVLGRGVTVGHRVVIHGARIGDGGLVGMGAVVLEARVGARCLIGAGALVLAGFTAPEGHLILGSPARVVRRLKPSELRHLSSANRAYGLLSARHRSSSRVVFP